MNSPTHPTSKRSTTPVADAPSHVVSARAEHSRTQTADALSILDAISERVVRYRIADLRITYCNDAWRALFDVELSAALGQPLDKFLSPNALVGLRRQLELLGPDTPVLTDTEARSALNDPDLWLEWVDRYLDGPDGPEVLTVGRDVTARRDAEIRLAKSEAEFRNLSDNSCDVVWRLVTQPVPRFDYVSPSVERITGYPPEYFLGEFSRLLDVVDEAGRRAVARSLDENETLDTFDMRVRRPDGSVVVCETRATRIGDVVQGSSRDVTEVRQLRERLTILASHDPLTGLPNRRRLAELLGAALSDRSTHRRFALAYVDLDDLKVVNDTHGHAAGDALICGVADRLTEMARPEDVVARIGGDEFVVVAWADEADDTPLKERIERALDRAIDIGHDIAVVPHASIGTADTIETDSSPSSLIAAADQAMYVVKRERRVAQPARLSATASPRR